MYSIEYGKKAQNFIESQSKKTALRIIEKIDALATAPYADHNNVKKLKGRDGYRLRIGNIRVIYDVIDDQLLISVIDAGFRGSVYS